jgi:hypothetical protein
MRPAQVTNPVQLLVEGKDPLNFFGAFAKHLALEDIEIKSFGGVNDLGEFLQAFVRAPGFAQVRSIGIIRDAERSSDTTRTEASEAYPQPPDSRTRRAAAAAFQSVCTALRNAGLPVPMSPVRKSVSVPIVSVLILPGEGNDGMLETLLCETFANTSVDRCISEFFECVGTSAESTRYDKARAHAYLATKPEPHVSVGVAAQKGYRDFDHDAFADTSWFLMSLSETRLPPVGTS